MKQNLEPAATLDVKSMIHSEARKLEHEWASDPRWKGVTRDYTAEDVLRLRGSFTPEHTIARMGAERLWHLMQTEPHVKALGALTGNQAIQMVKGGLKAIYLSGWQTAADNNTSGQMYPDQSLYAVTSVPELVRRINNALRRADQIEWAEAASLQGADARARASSAEGRAGRHWMAPILADAEAGFGGPLNAFELMKGMIEAGAAGVHWEDQLASEKKCGHLGGKVLIPTQQHIRTLTAARLAADICDVPTVIVARTDAEAATLITSDVDPRDQPFVTGERTPEGFYRVTNGIEPCIARGVAYAPYADVIWMETKTPDLDEARHFAEGIHAKFPEKMLAYNCSPSFNWRKKLSDKDIARFQDALGEMGYKFQFITLAGFHALNLSMFELARGYSQRGMSAYVELQEREFALEKDGYTATKHQREVGTGYFDEVSQVVSGGKASTLAYVGSTEAEQFQGSNGGNGHHG